MNFKDAYKSCNDEISGNREILASILSGEAKKKAFNFRPLLACAAMVLLVVSAAFFGLDTLDTGQQKPTRVATTDGIHTTQTADTKTEDISSTLPEESVTKQNKDTLTQAQSEPQLSAVEKGDTETAEAVVSTPQPTVPDEPAAETEPADDGISTASMLHEDAYAPADEDTDATDAKVRAYTGDMPKESVTEPDTEALNDSDIMTVAPSAASSGSSAYSSSGGSGGGGGSSGGSASAGVSGAVSGQTKSTAISLESYFDYLGINIVQKALLPSDMSFEARQTANVRKSGDRIVSDSLSISAYSSQNSGRYLTLTVSKTSGLAKAYVNGTNVPAVTGDDTLCTAYMMAGDISITVTAQNVTKDEINRMMNSLKN